MPSWVAGAAGTFAISVVSAYFFLRLRFRGSGYPFGHGARLWAIAIVVVTAVISTGLGVAAFAANGRLRAAFIGLILPSGLWLGKTSLRRHRTRSSLLPRKLVDCITFPFRRLNGQMGEDMQHWCDARSLAVSKTPELISDAAEHYYLQVVNQLKDDRVREELDRWRGSIAHKIRTVQLIRLDTTPARLQAALQRHPSTRDTRKYTVDDPSRLARRLESEAENELQLLLAYVYRLGYRKLLIYGGFKPPPELRRGRLPHRHSPAQSS